ncbi:N-acetylglutamate synthase [Anaerolineales bacterium]|nr:N-acetylglutamate synthase [Anaerolineales bacterium]
MNIREFRFPDDYAPTLKLWQSIETGVKVGRSDTFEEIQKKVQRDPDLFLLAEHDGQIVGTIIGGYDGRRGMIYHLAVDQSLRKQGIGDMLLSEVEKRLQARGCVKCYLLVFADNERAIHFYENRGWVDMKEDKVFGKEFP